jgi:single-strand DNA-binding protein
MILTGLARLGADAELRYTTSGEPVANLRLAFNYGQKGEDGNKPTQWVDAALFGKRAESLAKHLTKGTAVVVVLSDPHIETWTKQGQTVGHKLAGRVLEIEFAGGGREAGSGKSGGMSQPASDSPSRHAAQAGGFSDLDDDYPF